MLELSRTNVFFVVLAISAISGFIGYTIRVDLNQYDKLDTQSHELQALRTDLAVLTERVHNLDGQETKPQSAPPNNNNQNSVIQKSAFLQ